MSEGRLEDLVLEWADVPSGAPGGVALALQVRLATTGHDRLEVVHSVPCVRVLDADGSEVGTPGWLTASGRVAVLAPGQEQLLACRVELRGPRAGADRAPLPAGQYVVECSLGVGAGTEHRTLRTEQRQITVTARVSTGG